MTIITRIKIAAAILVVVALAGWTVYALALQARLSNTKGQLEIERQQTAALVQDLAARDQEIEANRAALAKRELIATELAAQTEALRYELNELYLNNEPCAAWADSAVPGPVLDRLRK